MKTPKIIYGVCATIPLLMGMPAQAQTSKQSPYLTISTAKAAGSTREVSVAVGQSIMIDTPLPVERVALGLGDYAEATAIGPSEILVNGKSPGETTMIVWEKGSKRQFITVNVRAASPIANDRLEAIRNELETELPGQPLKLSADGGNIFLRGTVNDLNSSDRAVQIASTAGKVVNLLYVKVPQAEPQIMLKVRFASIDRNKSKQLGINAFSTGVGNVLGGISTGQSGSNSLSGSNGAAATGSGSNNANITAYFPGLGFGAAIQALESKGLVEMLAQPNLLAFNGKQASFLAGGEYPFPVVQGSSGTTGPSVSISFKEYGIRLNFIPTITARGTIHLQMASEVSSLDFANAVTLSGFEVPAIASRKVKTEIELAEGETFGVGGLLDNRETETFQKIPFLGDIPVLGKFFQSLSRNKTNSELIVIITPEIVNPVPVGTPVPNLKFSPDFSVTAGSAPARASGARPNYAPETVPVEQLVQSMKASRQLNSDNSSSSSQGGSGGVSGPQ